MGRKKKSKSSQNSSSPQKDSSDDIVNTSKALHSQDLDITAEKKEALVVSVRKIDVPKKSKSVKDENERIVYMHPDDAHTLDVKKNDKVFLVEVEEPKIDNQIEYDKMDKMDKIPHIIWSDNVVGGKVEPKFIALCKVVFMQKDMKAGSGVTSKRNNAFSPKSPSANAGFNPGSIQIYPPSLAERIFPSAILQLPTNTNSMITSPSSAASINPATPTSSKKSSTTNFSFKSFVTSPSSTGKSKTGEKIHKKILIIPLKEKSNVLVFSKQLLVQAKQLHLKPLEASNSSLSSSKAFICMQTLKRSKKIIEQMVLTVCNGDFFRINDIVTISFQGRRMKFQICDVMMETTNKNKEPSHEGYNERLESSMEKLQLEESQSHKGNGIIDRVLSQLAGENVHKILYGISQETKVHFNLDDFTNNLSSSTISPSPLIYSSEEVKVDEGKSEEHETKLVAGLDLIIDRIHKFLIPSLLHPELFPRTGPIRAPKGILIHGAHGCGKSSLAQQIERDFSQDAMKTQNNPDYDGTNIQVQTVFINCASIQATTSIVGEAERKLTKLFEKAEYRTQESVSTLLILDDVHLICPRRGEAGSAAGSDRVASTLLALMDGIGQPQDRGKQYSRRMGNVAILAVSTSPALLDPALRRAGRLDNEIEIPNPDDSARSEILEFALSKLRKEGMSLPQLDKKSFLNLAKLAKGFTGGDLILALKEAVRCAVFRPISSITNAVITYEDIQKAIKKTKPSAIKSVTVEIPSVPWTSIGGMDEVKNLLREAIELPLTHSHLFQSLNIPPPRGVLLYGPPGCSKTLMARALATEGHMNFLTVKGPELLSKWLGESERQLASLFRRARQASPCVIFFDEIDAIASKRGTGEGSGGERMLSQLLTELDGINITGTVPSKNDNRLQARVVVVGATNRPDLLDNALTRPGRIDRMIYVGLPDQDSREAIFRLQFKDRTCDPNLDISRLAMESSGFSGAEIVSICREAALYAIEEIDEKDNGGEPKIEMKHIEQSIGKTKRQITPQMLEFYNLFKSKR